MDGPTGRHRGVPVLRAYFLIGFSEARCRGGDLTGLEGRHVGHHGGPGCAPGEVQPWRGRLCSIAHPLGSQTRVQVAWGSPESPEKGFCKVPLQNFDDFSKSQFREDWQTSGPATGRTYPARATSCKCTPKTPVGPAAPTLHSGGWTRWPWGLGAGGRVDGAVLAAGGQATIPGGNSDLWLVPGSWCGYFLA